MSPRQFQLEGPSLPELRSRVRLEFGSDARVVAAETVTVGGIWGFFASRHYRVTVEPAEQETAVRGAYVRVDSPTHAGIAALVDSANEMESHLRAGVPDPSVSTGSEAFARLMDDLTFNTTPARAAPIPAEAVLPVPQVPFVAPFARPAPVAPAAPPAQSTKAAPVPLGGPGDLVLIIGLADEALAVGRTMAQVAGAFGVKVGGEMAGDRVQRVEDRRSALAARARGVESGHSVFIVFGLARDGQNVHDWAHSLSSIGADQVWVVVDAGRKPHDTALWVTQVASVLPVDAVAVTGTRFTTTPETVNDLDIPVRVMDDVGTSTSIG